MKPVQKDSASKTSFFQRAASEFSENPIKIYAGIYLIGDILLGLNPEAGLLWKTGSVIAFAANLNKVIFGKGGKPIDAADFKLSLRDIFSVVKQSLTQPLTLFTAEHWRETAQAFSNVRLHDVLEKLKRTKYFWRYPLDSGWLAYAVTSSLFVADALTRANGISITDAAIGSILLAGSATGFLTDNNKLVGRTFSAATALTIGAGLAYGNAPLALAACVYLYGNHLISKVASKHQSDYTATRTETPHPAKPETPQLKL